jgi:hypothetical protein
MSSLSITCMVFACVVTGALAGMAMRAFLPKDHLSGETREFIKLGMGLIGTMTALVLGLLIASAKGSFDTQRNGLAQLSGYIIFIDRALAHCGSEASDARALLRVSVADMLQRTWPQEGDQPEPSDANTRTEGRYEALYEKIQEFTPKNDAQRTFQALALKTALDAGQLRWQLFSQKGGSLPPPVLAILVAWLTLLMASFGLFTPCNATVVGTLLICAFAIASALFLILELDRPFAGMIQVSSAPVRNALAQLGR